MSVKPIERVRKEQEIFRNTRNDKRLRRILSLIVPGAGHLYAGAALRGAVLVSSFSFTVITGLLMGLVMPWPSRYWDIAGGAGLACAGLLLLLMYSVAFLGSTRVRGDSDGS